MTAADVHAQLGEVIAGVKPGRTRADETIVFDSTGRACRTWPRRSRPTPAR
jgi:alanine dehydrogenase